MEYLIKHLNLEETVTKLGSPNKKNKQTKNISKQEFEKLRKEMLKKGMGDGEDDKIDSDEDI